MILWGILAVGAVALIALALQYAPARTAIVIDTSGSTARADMRLLWGIGPSTSARWLPRATPGEPIPAFNDVVRIGHALMTPGIADVAYAALRRLYELKPKLARFELGLNLGDTTKTLVVETAAKAALAAAPAAVRDTVALTRREAPGAEIVARFELYVSPARLSGIWGQFTNSRPAREFRQRLKRNPKPVKKPVREVRAS